MANNKYTYEIKVEGLNGVKTLDDLLKATSSTIGGLENRKRILEDLVKNVDRSSKEFKDFQKELNQTNLELKRFDAQIEGVGLVEFAENATRVAGALTGAFALGTIAVDTFGDSLGVSKEELEKAEASFQKLLLAVQSFQALSEGFKAFSLILPSITTGVNSVKAAFIGLNTVTKASIIGVGLAAVALVVTYWEDLSNFISDSTSTLAKFKQLQTENNQAVIIAETNLTKAKIQNKDVEKNLDELNKAKIKKLQDIVKLKNEELINTRFIDEIEGKQTELINAKLELEKEILAQSEEKNRKKEEEKQKNKEIADKQKQRLDEEKAIQQTLNNLISQRRDLYQSLQTSLVNINLENKSLEVQELEFQRTVLQNDFKRIENEILLRKEKLQTKLAEAKTDEERQSITNDLINLENKLNNAKSDFNKKDEQFIQNISTAKKKSLEENKNNELNIIEQTRKASIKQQDDILKEIISSTKKGSKEREDAEKAYNTNVSKINEVSTNSRTLVDRKYNLERRKLEQETSDEIKDVNNDAVTFVTDKTEESTDSIIKTYEDRSAKVGEVLSQAGAIIAAIQQSQINSLKNDITSIDSLIESNKGKIELINSELQSLEEQRNALQEDYNEALINNNLTALTAIKEENDAVTKSISDQRKEKARLEKENIKQADAKLKKEEEVAKKEQQIAKQNALIAFAQTAAQTGLAVANIAASSAKQDATFGIATVASIAAVLAAVVGAVASAKQLGSFAEGGFTDKNKLGERDESGFRVAGIVHEGEYVVPKKVLDSGLFDNEINRLEAARKGSFLTGGFTSNNVIVNNNNDEVISLLNVIASKSNVVKVSDINDVQNKLNSIEVSARS
jgi:tubulin-specific chaperone A